MNTPPPIANKWFLTQWGRYNSGMIKIKGSQMAESLKGLVKKHLKSFSLNINQIMSITINRASIMVKLGELVKPLPQVCLAHAIHLAVCNVLYKKQKKGGQEEEE